MSDRRTVSMKVNGRDYRREVETRMTLGFLDHMVSLPFQFFQRRSTGDLMMRVDSNGVVRETVTGKSMAAVLDGVFVVLYAIVIFYVNPLLGVITAGPLSEAVAQAGEIVEDAALLPHQADDFLLRVRGDSMIGDGILDGDLVLLRPGALVESSSRSGLSHSSAPSSLENQDPA